MVPSKPRSGVTTALSSALSSAATGPLAVTAFVLSPVNVRPGWSARLSVPPVTVMVRSGSRPTPSSPSPASSLIGLLISVVNSVGPSMRGATLGTCALAGTTATPNSPATVIAASAVR